MMSKFALMAASGLGVVAAELSAPHYRNDRLPSPTRLYSNLEIMGGQAKIAAVTLGRVDTSR